MLKLVYGDCLEEFGQIKDSSIDMVLADPPYQTTSCAWDSGIPLEPLWGHLKRIIKPDGAIVLTAAQPFTSILVVSQLPLYKHSWVWVKNRCGNFMAAQYNPLKYTEDIVVFSLAAVNTKGGKGGGKTDRPFLKYNPIGVNLEPKEIIRKKALPTDGINRWNKLSNEVFESKGSQYPKNVLYFDAVPSKNRIHPTQKPVPLMKYLIQTYTNEGDLVLDFSMGSGTTGVACKALKRDFIGIEKDRRYYEAAQTRCGQIDIWDLFESIGTPDRT